MISDQPIDPKFYNVDVLLDRARNISDIGIQKPKMSNKEYLDWVLVDFLIQIDKGIAAENCRVRFTKKDLEHFIEDSGLNKINET